MGDNNKFIENATKAGYSQQDIQKYLELKQNNALPPQRPRTTTSRTVETNVMENAQSPVIDFFGSGFNAAVDMVKAIPLLEKSALDLMGAPEEYGNALAETSKLIDSTFKYRIAPENNNGVVKIEEDGSIGFSGARSIANGIGNGVGQLAIAIGTGGESIWGRLASNTLMNFPSVYESAEQAGLDKKSSAKFSLLLAPILAATEELGGLQKSLAKNIFGKAATAETKQIIAKLRNEAITETLEKAGKGEISDETFERLAKDTSIKFLTKIKNASLGTLKEGTLPEMGQEMFQDALQQGAEQMYDKFFAANEQVGQGKFGTEFLTTDPNKQFGGISIGGVGMTKKAFVSQVNNGVLGGLVGGSAHIAINSNPAYLQETLFGFIDDHVKNGTGDVAMDRITKLIDYRLQNNEINEQDAQKLLKKAQQIYDVSENWKDIDNSDMLPSKRYEAYNLTANTLPVLEAPIQDFENTFKATDLPTAIENIDMDNSIDDFKKGSMKKTAMETYTDYYKATQKREAIKGYLQQLGTGKQTSVDLQSQIKAIDDIPVKDMLQEVINESIKPKSQATKEIYDFLSGQNEDINSDISQTNISDQTTEPSDSNGQSSDILSENLPDAESGGVGGDVTEAEKMQFGAGYKDYNFKKESVPTSKIKITEQPSLSERKELVEDIKANGIKEPIVVEYDKESDNYYVKNGNNRAAIAKELGIAEIPTIIAEYKGESQENNKISSDEQQRAELADIIDAGITENPEGAEEAAILNSLGLSLENESGTRNTEDNGPSKTNQSTSQSKSNDSANDKDNKPKSTTSADTSNARNNGNVQQTKTESKESNKQNTNLTNEKQDSKTTANEKQGPNSETDSSQGQATESNPKKTVRKVKGTPQSRRVVRNPEYLKALDYEVETAYDIVLQSFISGTKVAKNVIEGIFKQSKGEIDARKFEFINNKDGYDSIDALANNLWENQDVEIGGVEKFDTQDFANAIEEALTENSSRKEMVDKLNQKYGQVNPHEDFSDEAMERIREMQEIDRQLGYNQTQIDEAYSTLYGMTEEEIDAFFDEQDDAQLEAYLDSLDKPASKKDEQIAEVTKAEKALEEAKKERQKAEQDAAKKQRALDANANENQIDMFGRNKPQSMFDDKADQARIAKEAKDKLEEARKAEKKAEQELYDKENKVGQEEIEFEQIAEMPKTEKGSITMEIEEVPLETTGDGIVYRGIDKRGFGGNGSGLAGLGRGLYTTNSKEEAQKYAWEDGRTKGKPIALKNAKPINPLVIPKDGIEKWINENLPKSKYKYESEFRDNLAEYITGLGYDGITLKLSDGVEAYVKYTEQSIKQKPNEKSSIEKVDDEIANLWDDLASTIGAIKKFDGNGGPDPKALEIGIKLVMAYGKKGIYQIGEMAEDMAEKFGEVAKDILPYLKDAYNSVRGRATREERAKFNNEDEVFDYELKNIQDGKNDTAGIRQLPEQSPEGNGNNRGNVDRTPKGKQEDLFSPITESGGVKEKSNSEAEYIPGRRGTVQNNESSGGGSRGIGQGGTLFVEDETPSNFVLPDNLGFTSFNKKARMSDNIGALKLIATLKKENRSATQKEQEILSKYVGWGGLKVVYNNEAVEWTKADEELRPLFGELEKAIDELENLGFSNLKRGIKQSVDTAFYTPTPLIKSIYSAIQSFGFKHGNILDPSAGIGHFFGAMPTSIRNKSRLTSVELEPLTAFINKQLYPNTTNYNTGYENARLQNNNFDLVVSNIPFGNFAVSDKTFNSPELSSLQNQIHNYFFAKAIQQTKEGGLIAFITTSGTMDTKGNSNIREYINKNTEFIGALRLPNSTFSDNAGTSVVSDLIFLKKNTGEKNNTDFNTIVEIDLNNKSGTKETPISVNKYFIDNPSHVIGKLISDTNQFAKNVMNVIPNENANISEQINSVISSSFPKNIYQNQSTYAQKNTIEEIANSVDIKENEIYIGTDGKSYKSNGIDTEPTPIAKKFTIPMISSFINLRETLKKQYELESDTRSNEEEVERNRARLNRAYDSFVSKHGTINASMALVLKDNNGFNMIALENKIGPKSYAKADIFKKRVIQAKKDITKADNISDAINISLNEQGSIDIDRVSSLLGQTAEKTIELHYGSLFYDTDGSIVDRATYLSGNVKKKLAEAREIAKSNQVYEANVSELEKVIPKDVIANQIDVNIGARWIPTDIYRKFISELLNSNVEVAYSNGTDTYKIKGNSTVESTQKYGTERKEAYKIIEDSMAGKVTIVQDAVEGPDGKIKYVFNQVESEKAQEKQELINENFEFWIWKDQERRDNLGALYNAKFNTNVKKRHDGSHITFDGINSEVTLAKHQLDGAAMLIANKGGIMDHMVGAGKTYLMISAAIKMKQMGLINKPMITGLKSTIPHLIKDAKHLFPGAKILSPSLSDFSAKNRKRFLAKIQNNDWDLIIMSHEQFGSIPQDSEIQIELINEEISQLEEEIRNIEKETGNSASKSILKGLEARIRTLKTKLVKLTDVAKDVEILNFKQIGIDKIFVDESQMFKNLEYSTRINRVAGLGNPTGSKRSFNMLTAIRTLQKHHGGDMGTTFLSGTPISNSLVEMYLLFKYLRPSKMKELGYNTFDAWSKQFTVASNKLESSVTGTVKQNIRFREFINIPELSILYSEITDLRNDDNLKLPKPKVKGGGPKLILVQQSEYQQEWTNRFIKFAEQPFGDRDGDLIGKGELTDNEQKAAMIMLTTLSAKLAIDVRLIDKNAEDNPTGKLSAVAKTASDIYFETSGIKGTQLIFCDTGTPKSQNIVENLRNYIEDELNISVDESELIFGEDRTKNIPLNDAKKKLAEVLEWETEYIDQVINESKEQEGKFNVYDDVKKKLIQNGVPPEQIVFIHSYKTAKSKEDLFDAVNAGNIRIVLGSTQKLGTGVNCQARIVALHHIDAQWNPAAMEQRNGRGIRQKNMNAEVAIFNYATEKTVDAYKYELIATKQSFINQVKSGNLPEGERSLKEEDGEDMGFGAFVALISGNPLHYEKTKLESSMEKLKRSKKNFLGEVYDAEAKLQQLKSTIPNGEAELVSRKNDLSKVKSFGMNEDGTKIKVVAEIQEGKPYESTKELGEQIIEQKKLMLKKPIGHTQTIGTVNGMKLQSTTVKANNAQGIFQDTVEINLRLVGDLSYNVTSSADPTSQGIALSNAINKMEDGLMSRKNGLDISKGNVAKFKEISEKKWEKEDEYEKTATRLKEVNDALVKETDDKKRARDEANGIVENEEDAAAQFATGNQTTSTEQEKAESQAIIDFFKKGLKADVFAPTADFDSMLPTVTNDQKMISESGKVLAFVKDGKIYLNPKTITPQTTFHEIIHIQQSLIESAAKKGDAQAAIILKRFDVLLGNAVNEIISGKKSVTIDGVKVDLSSDVYRKGENESDAMYRTRVRNELWSYIQAPVNESKWKQGKTGVVERFIEAVKKFFRDKLGFKKADNIQSMTLSELIDTSANSLMKGEYFDSIKNGDQSMKAEVELGLPLFAMASTTIPLIDDIKQAPELGLSKVTIARRSFPIEYNILKNKIKGRMNALGDTVPKSIAVSDFLTEYMNDLLNRTAKNADGTEKRFAFVDKLENMRNSLSSASSTPLLESIYDHIQDGTPITKKASQILSTLTDYHIQFQNVIAMNDAVTIDNDTIYDRDEFKNQALSELKKGRDAVQLKKLEGSKYGKYIAIGIEKYTLAVSSLSTWAKLLAGGENSMLNKLVKTLDAAQDKQYVMAETARDMINGLQKKIGKGSTFNSNDILKSATQQIGTIFSNHKGDNTLISEGELLHMYLTLKNDVARARFFEDGKNGIFELKEFRDKQDKVLRKNVSLNITSADYKTLENRFASADWQSKIDDWTKANKFLYNYVNDAHLQDTGTELGQADGFYYPLVHGDGIKSYEDYLTSNKFLDNLRSTKSRSPERNANYLVVDAMQLMDTYINTNSKYAAYAMPLKNIDVYLKEADSFFRDNDMLRYVEWYNKFKKEFEDPSPDKLGEIGKRLLSGFVISRLGLNPFVTLKQYSSLFIANNVIPYKYIISSLDVLGKNAGGVIKSFVPGLKVEFDEVMNEMLEHSATARRRLNAGQNYFDELVKSGIKDYETVVFGKNIKVPFSKMTQNISAADRAVSSVYWVAAKKQVASETSLSVGSKEYWNAVNVIYSEAVVQSQSSIDDVNRAHITKDANILVKGLTLFSGQAFSNYNSFMGNVIEHANNPNSSNKMRLARSIMNVYVYNALMVAAIDSLKYAQNGDDEDKLKKKAMRSMISNSYQNLPILAPIIDQVWSKVDDPRFSRDINYPVLQIINDGASLIGNLANEKYERAVIEGIKFGAEGIGIPMYPFDAANKIITKK